MWTFKVILHLWRASTIYCPATNDTETGRPGAFPEISEVWTMELASAEAIFFGSAPSFSHQRRIAKSSSLRLPLHPRADISTPTNDLQHSCSFRTISLIYVSGRQDVPNTDRTSVRTPPSFLASQRGKWRISATARLRLKNPSSPHLTGFNPV
jgi:hypothetical protein